MQITLPDNVQPRTRTVAAGPRPITPLAHPEAEAMAKAAGSARADAGPEAPPPERPAGHAS
jgi:hypothetical protein